MCHCFMLAAPSAYLLWGEDSQTALWRDPVSEELQCPAKSHASNCLEGNPSAQEVLHQIKCDLKCQCG